MSSPHKGAPPAVTVLIATYNYGRTLPRALESVFAQTLPSEQVEVIVVDDGSTDETRPIAEGYANRLRYLYQDHQGLPAACNLGIREARGEYLIRAVPARSEAV